MARRRAGTGGGGKKQIAQILSENPDRFFLGHLPQPQERFGIELRFDLDAPGPTDGVGEPPVGLRRGWKTAGRSSHQMPNAFVDSRSSCPGS